MKLIYSATFYLYLATIFLGACGKSENKIRIRNESSDTLVNAVIGPESFGNVAPNSFTEYKGKMDAGSWSVSGSFKKGGTLIPLKPGNFEATGKGTNHWCMAITADHEWKIAAEDRKDPNQ